MAVVDSSRGGALAYYAGKLRSKVATRRGLLGDYDYKYLFTPQLFKRQRKRQPFFSIDAEIPVVLGVLLGLQHALAMLAGVITPPILIAATANFDDETQQYLVGASLVVSGILSMVQITRVRIPYTKYYIGSGMLSVVGTSFGVLPLVQSIMPIMYQTGYCPVDEQGAPLPCMRGYGALIGTSCVCALWEVLLSFMPARFLKKLFPSVVTGSVLVTMGASLVKSGFQDVLGGAGCIGGMCPYEGAPMAAPYGSARFLGLAFLVYTTIIVCEKWGAPIMKSCSVIVGLLVGCIVAGACGYFDGSGISSARAVSFPWIQTFPLNVYGPAVIPFLVVYTLLLMETLGDLTASMEVSRLDMEGTLHESRLQGGLTGDGLIGVLAGLMTITPMSTFAQNNGVIAITRCASRTVGYWACFILIIMGIFTKFAAALVAIPKPVLGGMTSFLFTSVLVSGLKIISTVQFTRRDRFVLTAALMPGIASVLIPDWFSHVFNYQGDNHALQGLLNGITIIMQSSYCLAGFVATILNLLLPQDMEVADDNDWDASSTDKRSMTELDAVQMDSFVPQYGDFEAAHDSSLKTKQRVGASEV
ncbi:AaceriAFR622Wp [[Ashbya] aceris (nom. inval.)]|nr:AaceriAFR622Wp [[Ashbya] aceris (nom. inval.)]